MAGRKAVRGRRARSAKSIPEGASSVRNTDALCPIWLFTDIDKSGPFAFDVSRQDFRHGEFLDKMIAYSNMTWAEIKRHTHDDGKSKHHALSFDALSREAQDRFKAKQLDEDSDLLFSFAFDNVTRIIGLRKGEMFHVLWYDPRHEVCPSVKRHT